MAVGRPASGLALDPNGQTATVTITDPTGTAISLFAEQTMQTPVANPFTLTGVTQVWSNTAAQCTISALVGGLEAATATGPAQYRFGDGDISGIQLIKPVLTPALANGTYPLFAKPEAYGGAADVRTVTDVVTTNGSAIITSATAAFTSADIGKLVSIRTGTTGLTTTVLSVQSGTQATLAATAGVTGTGQVMSLGTNSTAAITSAIAACPTGGTLYLSGAYAVNAEIVLPEHVTVRTCGLSEVTDGIGVSQGGSGPSVAPYLRGGVIVQFAAATNGVNMTGTGKNVHLHDLGVRFAPAIMFLNTGHGFVGAATATYGGGGHENGPFNPRWDNLNVFGHDGNHYAYWIRNSNLGTFTHLRAHGGGGLYFESDSTVNPFGNCVFIAPYFRNIVSGTAHGYHLKSVLIGGTIAGLNLMTFVRPQCNMLPVPGNFSGMGFVKSTAAQYLWRTEGSAGAFRSIDVLDPDLENDGSTLNPIDFGGVSQSSNANVKALVVRNFGILASLVSSNFDTGCRDTPGIYAVPTFVVGTGAGTGGTVGVARGDDRNCILTISTGTTPAAAGAVIATYTWSTLPSNGPVAILMTGFGNQFPGTVNFYAKNVTSTSFDICAGVTLAASGTYQLSVALKTDR